MFEDIKTRYQKGYIRDDQLQKFVELDVISSEEADKIKSSKYE